MPTVTFDYTPSNTDYVPLPTEPTEDYWDDELEDDFEDVDEPNYTAKKGRKPKWMQIYYDHLFLTRPRYSRRFQNSKTQKQDAHTTSD